VLGLRIPHHKNYFLIKDRVIESKRMRWARHVARRKEIRNVYKVWSGDLKGRDSLEDLCVEGRILLEWILGKSGGRMLIGFIWLRIGTSGGL
jgi:hypothetical protein